MESISPLDVLSRIPWPQSERRVLQQTLLPVQEMLLRDLVDLGLSKVHMSHLICEMVAVLRVLVIEWEVASSREMTWLLCVLLT